jgi:hypothetical protein
MYSGLQRNLWWSSCGNIPEMNWNDEKIRRTTSGTARFHSRRTPCTPPPPTSIQVFILHLARAILRKSGCCEEGWDVWSVVTTHFWSEWTPCLTMLIKYSIRPLSSSVFMDYTPQLVLHGQVLGYKMDHCKAFTYKGQHKTKKCRQPSKPRATFELRTPVLDWSGTICVHTYCPLLIVAFQ